MAFADMIDDILIFQAHLLAIVGLISIGLVPVRAWHVVKATAESRETPLRRKVYLGLAIALSVSCLAGVLMLTLLVVECLAGLTCYPEPTSGWSHLAMQGLLYIAFELAAGPLVSLARDPDPPEAAGSEVAAPNTGGHGRPGADVSGENPTR